MDGAEPEMVLGRVWVHVWAIWTCLERPGVSLGFRRFDPNFHMHDLEFVDVTQTVRKGSLIEPKPIPLNPNHLQHL